MCLILLPEEFDVAPQFRNRVHTPTRRLFVMDTPLVPESVRSGFAFTGLELFGHLGHESTNLPEAWVSDSAWV